MPTPTSERELIELFRELGSGDPEIAARHMLEAGGPELMRCLFLNHAWRSIAREGDSTWIDAEIATSRKAPDQPYSGLGGALARCREKGVTDNDLTEIARCLQASMLFDIGYLIDGPRYGTPPALEDVVWGLFQLDGEGRPFGDQIAGLHESVLEFDPTGREMRPLRSD